MATYRPVPCRWAELKAIFGRLTSLLQDCPEEEVHVVHTELTLIIAAQLARRVDEMSAQPASH